MIFKKLLQKFLNTVNRDSENFLCLLHDCDRDRNGTGGNTTHCSVSTDSTDSTESSGAASQKVKIKSTLELRFPFISTRW